MLRALNLMYEVLYIIDAVFVAFLTVEIVDIIPSRVFVLRHGLHRREALIASFKGARYWIGHSSHDSRAAAGANVINNAADARGTGFPSRSVVRRSKVCSESETQLMFRRENALKRASRRS